MDINFDGFSFSVERLTIRLAQECKSRGISTRAQAVTKWDQINPAQRSKLLGEILIAAMKFPGEPDQINPYAA